MMHPGKLSILPIFLLSFGLSSAAATDVIPSHAAVSGHKIFGELRVINGSLLTIQTRHGVVQVDGGTALQSHKSAVLVIGRAFMIEGDYDAAGTLHANVILRAKGPALWGTDT